MARPHYTARKQSSTKSLKTEDWFNVSVNYLERTTTLISAWCIIASVLRADADIIPDSDLISSK